MDILSDSLQIVWRVGIKLKLFTILLTGKRYYFKREMNNFSSKSWREQAIFWWNDIDVRYVLDQHADFDVYIASSLKQQSVGRHVGPQGHIILIPNQPGFALIPWCRVLCGEATNTNCIVFDLIHDLTHSRRAR
jgi:hypothetical protein